MKESTSKNHQHSWIVPIAVALIGAGGVIAAAWHPWTGKEAIGKEANPPTVAVDCDRLSSTNGSQKAIVHFKNVSNRTVAVYWVDYNGTKEFSFNLGPMGEQSADTFVSHGWCILDKSSGVATQAVTITGTDENVFIR